MFSMVKKPYVLVGGGLFVQNVIGRIIRVTLVAKSGDREYSTEAVSKPDAYCAFFIQGSAGAGTRHSFNVIAHRTEDGLLIEPAREVGGDFYEPARPVGNGNSLKVVLFGVRSDAATTGNSATHGVDYSQFTTVDAELMSLAIEHYMEKQFEEKGVEASAAH
jgi:hypothetical protein